MPARGRGMVAELARSSVRAGRAFDTYLENRLRMRPAGVVSKKLIGERKIANAIRSCNFLLACMYESVHVQRLHAQNAGRSMVAYLN